jgi:hypothetical protein
MKKIIAVLAIGAFAAVGYSQGYVNFSETSGTYSVSTNNAVTGALGKISASTGTTSPLYYFALVDQAFTGTAPAQITPSTVPNWSFAGVATNYLVAGSMNAGSDVGLTTLTAGTEYYVELVGWSATEGTSWSTVSTAFANGNLTPGGYFGESVVGTLTPGGASPSPAGILFSASGISSGFDLNVVATPEPTSIALGLMGAASLLALRRKKA